ncbi:MAG: TolC family protein [Planctomycetota bacterium]
MDPVRRPGPPTRSDERHARTGAQPFVVACACTLAALAARSAAQDQPTPEAFKGLADIVVPTERGADRRLDLTLAAALRLARANNTSIQIAELRPLQVLEQLRQAQAFFEPEAFTDLGYRRSKSVSQGAFSPPTERETFDARLGWRQRAITGGLFEMALAPVKFVQKQNAFFGRNDVSLWTSDLTFTYSQPLLRGGWTQVTLTEVRSAELSHAASAGAFERSVQDTLLAVVRAYWELSYARENFRAVFAARELALEQLRITEERIRVRQLAERDRVTDEAEVAQRAEQLIAAENEVYARADALRRLLLQDSEGELWTTDLVPSTAIEGPLFSADLDWRVPSREALRRRPDLKQLQADVSLAEVRQEAAKNELLPQLDFVGSYAATGADNNFNSALGNIFDFEAYDWSVRLQLTLPIGNSGARALLAQRRLETEQALRTMYAKEMDVVQEVRDAVRALRTTAERVRASQESVRLAETELDTAQKRFRAGELTPFDVRLRNQSLLDARTRLLRNLVDHRIAQAQLLYTQGLLGVPEGEDLTEK